VLVIKKAGYFGNDCYSNCGANNCASKSCSADGNCPEYAAPIFQAGDAAALYCKPGYHTTTACSTTRTGLCLLTLFTVVSILETCTLLTLVILSKPFTALSHTNI
jgi:hypothetical protein